MFIPNRNTFKNIIFYIRLDKKENNAKLYRMSEDKKSDALALLHSMLTAYQIALKEILGSGQAVFVQPVLTNFVKINEISGAKFAQTKDIDETFQNLSDIFKSARLLQRFHLEKLSEQKYMLHVDGCIWASQLHKKLVSQGFPCIYALMAMSIFQTKTGGKVKIVTSEFLEDGSKTLIEVT